MFVVLLLIYARYVKNILNEIGVFVLNDLKSADIQLIKRIIPHRYPFLLVDNDVEIDGLKSAKGIKNVTFNEP